ncbi:MAG: polyketide cyclase [Betaproteobacteria bacterium]|nr:polyketide cyclase [Betaproteobacteria bacterium]
MFEITVIIIVVLIAGVLGVAATKPDVFRLQRTTSIGAPSETIFALINDFRSWVAWSPWENKDPAMARSYGTVASGKGAVYEWQGNRNVGQGRMEITQASLPSAVTIKLDFLKPFEAHNTVEFTLQPQGDATSVTWAMQGPTPFFGKIMHVFVNMDRMVGKDFESGLANLKTVAEKQAGGKA